MDHHWHHTCGHHPYIPGNVLSNVFPSWTDGPADGRSPCSVSGTALECCIMAPLGLVSILPLCGVCLGSWRRLERWVAVARQAACRQAAGIGSNIQEITKNTRTMVTCSTVHTAIQTALLSSNSPTAWLFLVAAAAARSRRRLRAKRQRSVRPPSPRLRLDCTAAAALPPPGHCCCCLAGTPGRTVGQYDSGMDGMTPASQDTLS